MNNHWGIIGHDWAVDLLRGHMRADRVRHAYLITGAEGTGRKTLALAFAKAINCQQQPAKGEFCGQCRSCTLLDQLQHPDLHLIQHSKESRELKIDQIREIQRSLSLAPYEAKYRIALLPDFESASRSAANALLKTLEEPNPRVILLLTAFSSELLLPTITSRCDLVRLRTPSISDSANGLQAKLNLPANEAELLAQLAGGRPGIAIRYSEDQALLTQRKDQLDELVDLVNAPFRDRFKFAEALSRNRKGLSRAEQLAKLRLIIQAWESFWRDVLLIKTDQPDIKLNNPDYQEQIETLASRNSLEALEHKLIALERTIICLEANANIRLTLESLLLDL